MNAPCPVCGLVVRKYPCSNCGHVEGDVLGEASVIVNGAALAEETEMYLAKYKCDEAVEAIKEEQWRTGEVNILKLVKVHYDFFKSGGRAKPLDD